MVKCEECEGEGFIYGHDPDCDGTCAEGNCPTQERCDNCDNGWVREE